MTTATALVHTQFRQLLLMITKDEERTQMERQLATLALRLYDANPEHPNVVNTINVMARRALDA